MKLKSKPKAAPPAEAVATVTTKVTAPEKMDQPLEKQESIPPQVPVEDGSHGSVSLKLGVTVGLPQFSSVRVDVGITVPATVHDDPSEIYNDARDWVTERLQAEVDELCEGFSGE